MPGNTTTNSVALRRAQVYSDMILDTLKDGMLPDGIHRDVGDFSDGDTLNITTFGDVVLRDLAEDQVTPVDALDSGSITLTITEHVGAGNYLTDEMQEDSNKVKQFDAAIVPKHVRAIKERYETDMLKAFPDAQTVSNPSAINGYAHRYVASGTNQTMAMEDFIYAKLAMDKANLPDQGRILIVDGLVEATMNGLTNLVNVSNNPQFAGIIETGFGKNMRFIKNVFGFDIFISNRLKQIASESVNTSAITVPAPSSSATVTTGVANVAMCVVDDMTTPLMGAWRRMPRTRYNRDEKFRRDEYYTTARWGFGAQRLQSGVTILTSRTKYK